MGMKSVEISLNLQHRPNSGVSLTWKDVSVWATKKKASSFFSFGTAQQFEHVRILNRVNGYVKSGSLMAIMGASGAGKTTLMATISQRVKANEMHGDILVNGKNIDQDMMRRLSGFVPQEELVTKALTVNEHMQFMAYLMMDSRVSKSQRNRRITSLLSDLGLTKCTYTYLSALSGGELKRVSLAVQLLTDPPLLFCDEPSTGLDSYNASIVIEKLRNFASRGKAVICTIHQPASGIFELFHEVLLLAGGRVAFHGSVPDAAKHFTDLGLQCPIGYNQAEFYVSELAVISDREEECHKKIQDLCDKFERSKYGEVLRQYVCDGAEDILPNCTPINANDEEVINGDKEFQKYMNIKKVNYFTQFYWLMWRDSTAIKRSKRQTLIRFLLYMFIALLLATPYASITDGIGQKNIQNIEGLLYLIITETIFTFSYSVLHTFPSELPQMLREVGNGLYKPAPFYLCKMFLAIPGAICMPFVYTTVIFWFVGLNGGFFGYLLFCIPVIVSAIASTAYGFVMSASFESVETASLVSVPVDFLNIVFAGIYLNLSNLPLYIDWLRYTSPFYYGTEAVSILQWTNVPDIKCDNDPGLPCINSGLQVLDRYGFDPNDFYLDLFGLSMYFIILHLIAYCNFWRRSQKQSIY
ncbi:protein scarlet-like [Chrysoperla carnea]|uniref:protein scarlet-like n=1 Tax=Chrysoperla carnea TaxID=189513 RepID=UPI001D088DB3|nr:protein scarlet-like [Chrysoperla carnea]